MHLYSKDSSLFFQANTLKDLQYKWLTIFKLCQSSSLLWLYIYRRWDYRQNNLRKTKQQVIYFLHILPAASTYLEKCSLSTCPNASDNDGSEYGGWGQEASLRAKTNHKKKLSTSVYRRLCWVSYKQKCIPFVTSPTDFGLNDRKRELEFPKTHGQRFAHLHNHSDDTHLYQYK